MAILGAVSEDGGEPVIPLSLIGHPDGRVGVEAVVDTGFDGEHTLPVDLILQLGYAPIGTVGATLADGSSVEIGFFAGRVSWHAVLAAEGVPLVGMELLAGSRLTLDAAPGGAVRVEALS
ncbi:MAG: hypothetical protein WKF95_14630 [Rubrobacter sp.]